MSLTLIDIACGASPNRPRRCISVALGAIQVIVFVWFVLALRGRMLPLYQFLCGANNMPSVIFSGHIFGIIVGSASLTGIGVAAFVSLRAASHYYCLVGLAYAYYISMPLEDIDYFL